MFIKVIIVLFCVLTPLLITELARRVPLLAKIGTITVAYIVGCIVGLSGIFPSTDECKALLTNIASGAVPVAIPLMLFSSNVRSWRHLAPNFVKSLFMGLLACAVVAVMGFYLFGQSNPHKYAGISAMFVGLYTGGTANMATIKEVAGVDQATFLMAQIYQILVGAVYLVLIIVFGKYIARFFLPAFQPGIASNAESQPDVVSQEVKKDNSPRFSKKNAIALAIAFGLTIVILAAGYGVTLFFSKEAFMAVFMLTISLLAILSSLHDKVNSLPHTFSAGIYFILVFSLAVSAQVGGDMFKNLDLHYFLFVLFVTVGPLLVHILFNALLRVDADTTLVSSIALVTSPAFVPVMAGVLKNREVVGPGITVGLIGYAVGTYLGYGVYSLLLALC